MVQQAEHPHEPGRSTDADVAETAFLHDRDTGEHDALVVRAVTIGKPRQELYDFWRDFRNLAAFMENVERVDVLDGRRSHWVVKAPGGRTVEFLTDSGVFSRGHVDFGSRVLAENLPALTGRVLDLGCGYGFLGLAAKLLHPGIGELVLCDVNTRALGLARRNAERLGLPATILESDGFAAVEGRFDAILTNPPVRAGKAVFQVEYRQRPKDFCAQANRLGLSSIKKAGDFSLRADPWVPCR